MASITAESHTSGIKLCFGICVCSLFFHICNWALSKASTIDIFGRQVAFQIFNQFTWRLKEVSDSIDTLYGYDVVELNFYNYLTITKNEIHASKAEKQPKLFAFLFSHCSCNSSTFLWNVIDILALYKIWIFFSA